MKTPGNDIATGCAGCSRESRREFLEQVSNAMVVVLCEGAAASLGAAGFTEVSSQQSGAATLTYPVPAEDGVSIDKKEQILLVRFGEKVYAFPLACPHENTALRWRQNDMRFQCPRHDSKYRPDGTFMGGRATRNMDRYAVSRDGTSVVVDLTRLYQSDTHALLWAAASVPA